MEEEERSATEENDLRDYVSCKRTRPRAKLNRSVETNSDKTTFWSDGGWRDTSLVDMESISPFYSLSTEAKYSPPWQDLSIIGIAGSSGSGKTSVAMEIVKSLNLPWVVILVMVGLWGVSFAYMGCL